MFNAIKPKRILKGFCGWEFNEPKSFWSSIMMSWNFGIDDVATNFENLLDIILISTEWKVRHNYLEFPFSFIWTRWLLFRGTFYRLNSCSNTFRFFFHSNGLLLWSRFGFGCFHNNLLNGLDPVINLNVEWLYVLNQSWNFSFYLIEHTLKLSIYAFIRLLANQAT